MSAEISPEQIDTISQTFSSARLEFVFTSGDSRLKLIGGTTVIEEPEGYDISEPLFSIFLEGDKWIGVAQDMTTIEDKNISGEFDTPEEAARFIVETYNQSSAHNS